MYYPYLWGVKTTLTVRDDLYRKAKAQAALEGKTLGRFLEEALERMITLGGDGAPSWSEWARSIPEISAAAARDLDAALSAPGFRAVDAEMWQ